jgi:hypothetical protein
MGQDTDAPDTEPPDTMPASPTTDAPALVVCADCTKEFPASETVTVELELGNPQLVCVGCADPERYGE